MNWPEISFDWNQVRAFLATAEEGSFSGAARALQSTQPTISRQITALERSLGVTLLERGVRQMSLTQAGRELLDHVRAMGEAAALISMAADRQSQDVPGAVTVTATDLMSAAIRLRSSRRCGAALRASDCASSPHPTSATCCSVKLTSRSGMSDRINLT